MDTFKIKEDLQYLFNRCGLNVSVYVLAADEAIDRDKLVYPIAVVQNSQALGTVGMHWISWFIATDDDCGEYFDSFGLPIWNYPEIKSPVRYLVKENCYPLQSLFSSVCGQFCIYFLFNRASGVSYQKILEKFKSKRYNDRLVRDFEKDIPVRRLFSGGQSSVSRIKCLKCIKPLCKLD